jgi:hypothetical protein
MLSVQKPVACEDVGPVRCHMTMNTQVMIGGAAHHRNLGQVTRGKLRAEVAFDM